MKNFLLLLAGVAAAAVYYLATRPVPARVPVPAAPVDDLAHKLEVAWANHHTVV